MGKWFLASLALAVSAAAQSPSRVVLFDELVKVPGSQWRALTVTLKQRPATVEVDYTVVRGNTGVRAVLMTREEVDRFREGKAPRILHATSASREGKLRYLVTRPGDYMVLLDNRQERRGGAAIQLKIGLAYGAEHSSFEPGRLPDQRRRMVVAVSLLGFVVIGGWSGWRLWGAVARRRRAPLPPLA